MPSHRSVFEQQPVTLSQMLVDRGLDHHLRMLPAETGTDVPWDYIQIGWMDVPYTAAPPIQAVGGKAGGGWRERERDGRDSIQFYPEEANGQRSFGRQPAPIVPPGAPPGITVEPYPKDAHRRLFGSHAYLLSRAGARRLLHVGVPFELHMDMFLALAAQFGVTHGKLLLPSCVAQCAAHGGSRMRTIVPFIDSSIPHFDGRCSYKLWLPHASIEHATAAVGWAILAAWLAALMLGRVVCRRG